ncbi:MAG: hypothetical protein RIR86_767 [Acidobacteriota bacterium]|jgi:hypothetical protein
MLTTPVTNYTHIPYTLSPWFCSLIFKDFEKNILFFSCGFSSFPLYDDQPSLCRPYTAINLGQALGKGTRQWRRTRSW